MSDPFTPSPELAAIAKRWITAYAARKTSAVVNLFSASDAVTFIGSDEGEILAGDEFCRSFAAFADDQAVLEPENFQAKGYASPSLEKLAEMTREARIDIGQTGIASVMFTDIADSTALAETLSDGAWRQIVNASLEAVGKQVEKCGGKLLKSLGDGTLSSFPTASAAWQAALAIQQENAETATEPRLRLRVGVHTGDVVEEDDDVLGTVVNMAARVAALAAPDEIVVTDATRLMVGGARGLVFNDPASVSLKGLEGDHIIHRLAWQA